MLLETNCSYDFGNFRLDLTDKILLRDGKVDFALNQTAKTIDELHKAKILCSLSDVVASGKSKRF